MILILLNLLNIYGVDDTNHSYGTGVISKFIGAYTRL